MAQARLSGPPAIEPVYMPDDHHRGRTAVRRDHKRNSEQSLVSPLTPKSFAKAVQEQQSRRRSVSPVSSSATSEPSTRRRQRAARRAQPLQRTVQPSPRESYPPAHIRNVPPRRPVATPCSARNGTAAAQRPQEVSAPPRHSAHSEHSIRSRPRSISAAGFQAVPDTYLQDYQDHALPTTPAQTPFLPIRAPRPRSLSVPTLPSGVDQREYERRTCASCGKAQRNCATPFVDCKYCRGVYYCSVPCWQNRVCHRSVKCAKCDCTQASNSVDFTRCLKCLVKGREFWYCSDDCWDQRDCHVRADQLPHHPLPPRQMPRAHHPYRQEFRAQRPSPEGSNRVRRNGTLHAQVAPRLHRDLEAQRAKGKRKPFSDRGGCSATIWACMIIFVLLCIFIPIIAIFGGHAH